MSRRVCWNTGGICVLLLSVSVAAGQQTRYIFGTVLDGNDQGVAQTEVRCEVRSDTTTESGGFKSSHLFGLASRLHFRCSDGQLLTHVIWLAAARTCPIPTQRVLG